MREADNEDVDLKERERKADKMLNVGITLIVLTLVTYGGFIYFIFDSWGDRGTFGDMFGGITSLFTGLVFVGLVYTIFQQKIQLKMQRTELADTREEFKEQNKTMRLQRLGRSA